MTIVGESGSGKTTVIRAILGSLPNSGKITNGKIFFENHDLLKYSVRDWLAIRGKNISMIFQDSGNMLNPIQTIGKQFIEYLQVHDNVTDEEAYSFAVEMLTRMNLPNPENIMKSYPFELSGGMCQRVAIALAIMNQPSLLLADEPTSALDVASQDMTIETLLALRKKTDLSILLVTHNMEVARRLADEIGVMYQGRIIESGLPEEIWNDPKEDYTKKLIAAIPQPVKLVLDEG